MAAAAAAAAKWPWDKACAYMRAELTGPAAPNLLKGGACNECGWKPLDHGARAMLALACFVCVFCVSLPRCPVVPDDFRLRVRSRFNAPSSGDGAFDWLRRADVRTRSRCICAGAPLCCVGSRLCESLMTSVDAQALHGVFPSDIVSWRDVSADVSACSLSS